ncbi:MAG: hypothetical protein ACKESB_01505, partial [Candidatus Hodgkinia cicadicola]
MLVIYPMNANSEFAKQIEDGAAVKGRTSAEWAVDCAGSGRRGRGKRWVDGGVREDAGMWGVREYAIEQELEEKWES